MFPHLCITFTLNLFATIRFCLEISHIIIDKYPVSSQSYISDMLFSDNFTLIMAFFSLVVSDTNNSVGVPRWVLRLLIWWYYAQDKLGSKSNYHRRIWILNLLYVNLSLWLKPSCGYCTVILIHPEQIATIFIELAKVEVYVKKMFSSFHHFFIISHSRIDKKHAKESLTMYRNHALLCRLSKIYPLICFLFQTILVMPRKVPLIIWIYSR